MTIRNLNSQDKTRRSYLRSARGAVLSAEFAAALSVFLLITLFPLIELLTTAGAYTSVWFINNCLARQMGSSTDYATGLSNISTTATQLCNGPCILFAKQCSIGMRVYIVRTKITSGDTEFVGPNCKSLQPAEPNTYIYEYCVVSNGTIQPFIQLNSIPWLKDIPGLGKPMPVVLRSYAPVEDVSIISQSAPDPSWGGGGKGPSFTGFRLTASELNGISGGGPAYNNWRKGMP
ncbi:MAG: hypothetical protein IPI39_05120 [Candidatus Obscuribacter sp.]|nr:hypothetical protein [Candidatus Obscuribacter sp.]